MSNVRRGSARRAPPRARSTRPVRPRWARSRLTVETSTPSSRASSTARIDPCTSVRRTISRRRCARSTVAELLVARNCSIFGLFSRRYRVPRVFRTAVHLSHGPCHSDGGSGIVPAFRAGSCKLMHLAGPSGRLLTESDLGSYLDLRLAAPKPVDEDRHARHIQQFYTCPHPS